MISIMVKLQLKPQQGGQKGSVGEPFGVHHLLDLVSV